VLRGFKRASRPETSACSREVSVFDHESAATAASLPLASIPIRGQLDGLIVMGSRIDDAVERRLFERGMPTVVVDAESDRFPVVTSDEVAGGRLAATYLHRLGHRRYVYFLERQVTDYDSQALRRLVGFRRQLEHLGECELEVTECDPSSEATRVVARDVLASSDRPTAIVAHFDDMAVGVLLAAKDLGLNVPADVSVMGYDDGPIAVAADLTTIREAFEESGAVAARILLAAIDGPAAPRTVTLLDNTVTQRATTAPPALTTTGGSSDLVGTRRHTRLRLLSYLPRVRTLAIGPIAVRLSRTLARATRTAPPVGLRGMLESYGLRDRLRVHAQ
jgi:DNA-binding LacI/PurR family transcriptional regulator